MDPQLALADWVALALASLLLASLGVAIVITWVARYQQQEAPRPDGGRVRVRRGRTESAEVLEMRPDAPRRADSMPIPDRPPTILDAPASAMAPAMASGPGFELRQPGFFEDPVGRHDQRYWDGAHWTEHVKERGERFVDPL